MGTSSEGTHSENTVEAAKTLISALARNCYEVLEFRAIEPKGMRLVEYYANLRKQAEAQDMSPFEFMALYQRETLY
jgi:hypothetical protein